MADFSKAEVFDLNSGIDCSDIQTDNSVIVKMKADVPWEPPIVPNNCTCRAAVMSNALIMVLLNCRVGSTIEFRGSAGMLFLDQATWLSMGPDPESKLINVLVVHMVSDEFVRNYHNTADYKRRSGSTEPVATASDIICSICLEKEACLMFVPCKHICCCSPCAKKVDICPMCRSPIEERRVVRVESYKKK